MAEITGERVAPGQAIVDYDEKVFPDYEAEPGQRRTSSCAPCRSRVPSAS